MTVTVYRIEHIENGNGPYNNSKFDMADYHDSMDQIRHPTINNDSLLNYNWRNLRYSRAAHYGWFEDWYFAFSSIEQMRAWFYQDEWLELLDDHGFVLREYEVEDMYFLQGNAQCMLKKEKALCFNEERLTKYATPKTTNT